MDAAQVARVQAEGYRPWEIYREQSELKSAIDLICGGLFSHGDTELFRPLTEKLIQHDPFMVLADYRAYVTCQSEVAHAYRDSARWNRMSILNVARIGKFSSDRSIREYCERIWKVKPVPVEI
jgi:starch phosphorylase